MQNNQIRRELKKAASISSEQSLIPCTHSQVISVQDRVPQKSKDGILTFHLSPQMTMSS